MRALLDTHTFLWFVQGDPRLGAAARRVIEDPATDALLSPASHWEMAIKVSQGRLALAQPFDVFVPTQLRPNAIDILPIDVSHTAVVATLPFHHRDPFDRLIIAQ